MKRVIYLYKAGTLQRKDASLCLVQKNGAVEYLPIEQIDIIICFSEITLNKRVLSLLNKYQIVISFFNYYGNYIGKFTPKEYKDGKVLVEQVQKYNDDKERLKIAKAIIIGSLKNMLAFIKYYQKKKGGFDKKIQLLKECMEQIEQVEHMNHLLLLEAKAKQIYYSSFDILLEKEEFRFIKRTKNPPENEINAMLSYGYAMLYSIFLAILDRSSLYPQISFIHSLSKCNDSLQFDLADIFKPVIVDRLVIRLIRKKQIKKQYFEYKADGRCYLNKDGIQTFVKEFDQMIRSTVVYNNKSYSYRSLLSKEVHKLSLYIKGQSKTYKAFTMKW